MKKKKEISDSPENSDISDSKNHSESSASSFSLFLNSSSSSIRQIIPQRKGVYQTNVSNAKQHQNQILSSNRSSKKAQNNNIYDIIFDDTLLRTPVTKSFLNDQFCIQNRKFLFQKLDFSIFQEDELNKLLCHLREYSTYCAINREYSEAKKSDALFDKIQFELMQRNIPSTKKATELEQSFEEQKKEEMARLDNELYDFDEEVKERRDQLLNKQLNDSNEFETKWRVEKPPKYRKPSSKLLHLLASEKRLARIGKYDEAESYKAESEKLIEFEREQAQSLLMRDYKIAKSKLLKKQEEELKIFNETIQQQRDLILARRMASEETIQKRESIILDRIAQIPKAKNNEESSPLVENQNFVGNEWLKYGVGGNIARAMYDDHIDFENPIPPLAPPNDELEVKSKEARKRINNDDNKDSFQDQSNIKKVSQNYSPRLNSVGQNLRHDTKNRNKEISGSDKQKLSSKANSNKEQNRLSSSIRSSDSSNNGRNNINNMSSNSPRKPINRSGQGKTRLTPSSASSKNSFNEINDKKGTHSNRLSSVSRSSSKPKSVSSRQSKQNFENSNLSSKNKLEKSSNSSFSIKKESKPFKLKNTTNSSNSNASKKDNNQDHSSKSSSYLSNKSNEKNLNKNLSSGSFSEHSHGQKERSVERNFNSKSPSNNSLENKKMADDKYATESSIVSAASDEFNDSNA